MWVNEKLYLWLGKTNWNILPDIQVQFSVNLDKDRREFVGVSTKLVGGVKSIGFMTSDVDNDWLDDFSSSEAMTINFHGNEPKWSVKMAGNRDATKAFRSCIKSLVQLLDAIMGPGQNRHFTLSSIAADNSWSRAAMPSFKKPRPQYPLRLGERSGAPSGLRPSSFVMGNTPVEVQFTSAGCLNYPCPTSASALKYELWTLGAEAGPQLLSAAPHRILIIGNVLPRSTLPTRAWASPACRHVGRPSRAARRRSR